MIEPVYTIDEVARLAKLSKDTIRRMVRRGRLVPIRLGRGVRFKHADIKKWLEEGDACHRAANLPVVRQETDRTAKRTPDGATAFPWDKRRQARQS
ncbi:MAG: helix-turn-helix domain-containing protein [Chloroflexales bacterium]